MHSGALLFTLSLWGDTFLFKNSPAITTNSQHWESHSYKAQCEFCTWHSAEVGLICLLWASFLPPRNKGTRLLADFLNRRRGSISSFLDFFLTSLCQFAFCLSVHCEWGSKKKKKRVSLVLDLKIIKPTPLAEFIQNNNRLVGEAAPFHWKSHPWPLLPNSNMMSWKIPNCAEKWNRKQVPDRETEPWRAWEEYKPSNQGFRTNALHQGGELPSDFSLS